MEENQKPGDKEVVIVSGGNGVRRIGPDTTIQINLKTLFIALSLIMSALGFVWRDLSGKMDEHIKQSNEEIKELSKEIGSIKYQDLKNISVQLSRIDTQVQDLRDSRGKSSETPIRNENSQLKKPDEIINPTSPK